MCQYIFENRHEFPIVKLCPRCLMSAQSISLKTSDGHSLTVYEARPDKSPRGGIVLLQEIFGITGYIRRVCESYAGQGYHVVAPALFDRIRPGIELTYSKEDAVTGRDLRSKIPVGKDLRRSRSSQGAAERRGQDRDARLLLGRDDLLARRRPRRRDCRRGLLLRHADRSVHGGTAALSGADALRRQGSDRDARACRRAARGAGRAGRNSGLSGRSQLQLRRNAELSRGERGPGAATVTRISDRPRWVTCWVRRQTLP